MKILTVAKTFEEAFGESERSYYSRQYLTFEALEAGTFTFNLVYDENDSNLMTEISYSLDNGATWKTYQVDDEAITVTTPTIEKGWTVMWKGNGYPTTFDYFDIIDGASYFVSSGKFNVYGNLLSLVYGDDFEDKDIDGNANFARLFSGTGVVDAKNLVLPSGIQEAIYEETFSCCYELLAAPDFVADVLRHRCYRSLFRGCESLCNITMLATDTDYSGAFDDWVEGVAEEGVITLKEGTDLDTSLCPSGWEIKYI